MLRTAWRGDIEQRPPLTADERADRKDRMDSCPRNGFPSPTVSRRVYVDATSPDRNDRLDALTAEGFALLAQAQGERDRLEKERLRAERAEEEAAELALMNEFEEKEKLESDPPEEWNIERLKDFLREKGDRSMAGADKLGYPLCGNQPVRRVHDNFSLSHFSAITRPFWLGRAVRNRHRHAIEQASRRWRGGRRDD